MLAGFSKNPKATICCQRFSAPGRSARPLSAQRTSNFSFGFMSSYSFSLSMVRLLLFQKFCPALRVSCRSVENLRVLFEHIQKHFPHGRRHKGRKFTAHTPPPFCLYFWQRVLFSFLPPLEPPCVSPPVQRALPQRLSACSLQLLFRLPSWPSFQPSSP